MPRTIQTKTLDIAFIGLKRLIEQKAIGKPSGAPQSRVTAKISKDILKPSSKNEVTSKKDILNLQNKNYFWSAKSLIAVFSTPYFFANVSIVPSAPNFSSSALTLAVRSLPFSKPIP